VIPAISHQSRALNPVSGTSTSTAATASTTAQTE
jgi:hypothetical protein